MSKLGSCKNKNELRVMLEPLIDEYAKWVNETKTKVEISEKFDAVVQPLKFPIAVGILFLFLNFIFLFDIDIL